MQVLGSNQCQGDNDVGVNGKKSSRRISLFTGETLQMMKDKETSMNHLRLLMPLWNMMQACSGLCCVKSEKLINCGVNISASSDSRRFLYDLRSQQMMRLMLFLCLVGR